MTTNTYINQIVWEMIKSHKLILIDFKLRHIKIKPNESLPEINVPSLNWCRNKLNLTDFQVQIDHTGRI